MSWMGLAGSACLGLSLLGGLWMEQVRERPVYDRPGILAHHSFWLLWIPARWIGFLGGWLLLGRAWPRTALVLAIVLLLLWGWKRYLGSRHHWRRLVRQSFEKEKALHPEASDAQILEAVLYSARGRWGRELIQQIVADHPTPEGIADMIARMKGRTLPRGIDPFGLGRRRG